MGTAQVRVHRGGAPGRPAGRRAAHRRRRALSRRLRRRRPLRLAPDEVPAAGHQRLGRAELRDVLHRADRRAARVVGALVPQRRAGALPHPGRRPRAAHGDADPDRHRRGIRRQHPPAASPRTCSGTSSRTSAGRRSTISAAGCSRRTAATRPAGTRRPATRTCGSPPATSRSSDRARSSTSRRCWPGWASDRVGPGPTPSVCCPTTSRTSSR